MEYLTNQYVWAAGLAWLIFFAAAARYIACATKLSQYIDANCPELWPQLSGRGFQSFSGLALPRQARGLERLVLFNSAAKDHPKNAEFRELVSNARWPVAIVFLAFTAGVILLGRADNDLHPANTNGAAFQQTDR